MHALSGVPGLLWRRWPDGGQRVSAGLSVAGSLCGILGALGAVFRGAPQAGWFRLDGLAAFFLVPIFLVSALGAIYGLGYWSQARHARTGRKLRFFYGGVTAGLAGVAVAAHAVVFLAAWEVMALSAFFLITTEDEERGVRAAGYLYLVVTHLSTLCLFALFALWWGWTGSLFLGPLAPGMLPSGAGTVLFWLAVVAFGCKAGLMPLHIWLPSAHATAPSHVSALMSGVLIKIGIYGLIRTLAWVPVAPPAWWGGVLLVLGAVSGIVGVVLALGQHDLKRLLAYHSIENIGIIVMGVGLAVVGLSFGCGAWVTLGLAGALLHVWNHGLFKALLFLSAGSVIHATHTRELDRLGGVGRLMPRTALCFAVGAAAICGLPPLNGFVSEWLIYLGAFRALGIGSAESWPAAVLPVPALALIGGLAVACFVKAFGVVFLGEARSSQAGAAREVGPAMLRPLWVLAGGCVLIGLFPVLAAPCLDAGIAAFAAGRGLTVPAVTAVAPFGWMSVMALTLAALILLAAWGFRRCLRPANTRTGVTWDCGYVAPTARMQYTAASFAQMFGVLFAWVQRPRWRAPAVTGLFPGRAAFRAHVLDVILDATVKPAFRAATRFLGSFRFLQAGNIHAYLLYIVVFLIALLLWG